MNEETQLEAWMKENISGGGQLEPLSNPASSIDIRSGKKAYSDTREVIAGEWKPYEISSSSSVTPSTEWDAMWTNIWDNMGSSAVPDKFYIGNMRIKGILSGENIDERFAVTVYRKELGSDNSFNGSGGGYDFSNIRSSVIKFTANFSDFTIYINGIDVTANATINFIGFEIYYQIS